MDWPIFFSTFLTIFLAELGDKTQFAALAASSQTKSTGSVLLATVFALALAGSIGVILGSLLGKFVNPSKLKFISGVAFIIMGVWTLSRRG